MSVGVLLTVYAVVLLAELPDKSLFAVLVLGTRLRPLFVWLGVAAAFAVHAVLAVSAGQLLALAPQRLVELVVAVLFGVGALLVLRDDPDGDSPDRMAVAGGRAFVIAFTVVFLGEWGDVTQITTANFAAKYDEPVSVGLGAFAAEATAAAVALLLGNRLLERVPMVIVKRVAAGALVVLAVLSLLAATGVR